LNYKEVLEKQIERLEEAQEDIRPSNPDGQVALSKQIQSLIELLIDKALVLKSS